MRKLIYSINITLDGCLDHTKVNASEEMLDYFTDLLQNAGLLAYGRITYQLMVPYWPDIARDHSGQTRAAIDFAQTFDSIDKLVFSQTLENGGDERTRIVRTSPLEEIPKFKRQSGKDIYVGGVDLPSQLITHGLIDEYIFVVHPVLAGEGRRLFDVTRLQEKLQLKLVDTKVLKGGPVALHYTAG